jgi:hypothetical protein
MVGDTFAVGASGALVVLAVVLSPPQPRAALAITIAAPAAALVTNPILDAL